MATETKNLKYFTITIGLRSSYDLGAGNTRPDAMNGQYVTHNNADASVFEQIFVKLAKAMQEEKPTIQVTVEDDKYIIGDTNSPLSAIVDHMDSTVEALGSLQDALG